MIRMGRNLNTIQEGGGMRLKPSMGRGRVSISRPPSGAREGGKPRGINENINEELEELLVE